MTVSTADMCSAFTTSAPNRAAQTRHLAQCFQRRLAYSLHAPINRNSNLGETDFGGSRISSAEPGKASTFEYVFVGTR